MIVGSSPVCPVAVHNSVDWMTADAIHEQSTYTTPQAVALARYPPGPTPSKSNPHAPPNTYPPHVPEPHPTPTIPPDPLRKLHDLDRASPEFPKQLVDFLRGHEYRSVVPGLQGKDLTWFVEYLDNVSSQTISPTPISTLV